MCDVCCKHSLRARIKLSNTKNVNTKNAIQQWVRQDLNLYYNRYERCVLPIKLRKAETGFEPVQFVLQTKTITNYATQPKYYQRQDSNLRKTRFTVQRLNHSATLATLFLLYRETIQDHFLAFLTNGKNAKKND